MEQLIKYDKKFIIIGNMNACTYKEIFPLIADNKIWIGANEKGGTRKGNSLLFAVPDDYEAKSLLEQDGKKLAQVSAWWYTNLDFMKRHDEMTLYKKYDPETYPKYDNYDAIECSKSPNVPCDYEESWGIPIDAEIDEDKWEKLYDGKWEDGETYQWVIPASGTELYDKFQAKEGDYVNEVTAELSLSSDIATESSEFQSHSSTDSTIWDSSRSEGRWQRHKSQIGTLDIHSSTGRRNMREYSSIACDLQERDNWGTDIVLERVLQLETVCDSGCERQWSGAREIPVTSLEETQRTVYRREEDIQANIHYRNGVIGVPISFLNGFYSPDQFCVIGLAPERKNNDEATLQHKRYINAIQHKKDGTTCSGNKVNDGPVLLHTKRPAKYPYYTSETEPGKYLEVLYARVLIRPI